MSWPTDRPIIPDPWVHDPPNLRRLMLLPTRGRHPRDIPAEVIVAALAALAEDGDPDTWEVPGPDPGNVWTLAVLGIKFAGLSMYVIEYGESERRNAAGG